MSNQIYLKFEEIEDDVRTKAPKTVYKYRDWLNPVHKKIISEKEIWFASPNDLNDPIDIKTPLRFDYSEVYSPLFFQKIKMHFINDSDSTSKGYTDREVEKIYNDKWEEIKLNPKEYFARTYIDLINDNELYNKVGVFSCCKDGLNDLMWFLYGNKHNGFCIGFNVVELARNLNCGFGPVRYCDNIPFFSFINDRNEEDLTQYYLKTKKWRYEEEFRFIVIEDEQIIHRERKYPINCIEEIIIGNKFPKENIDEFIYLIKKTYSDKIPVYQVRTKSDNYGLEKYLIA